MCSATIHVESISRTSTFTKLVQSMDHQSLPWIASISTIIGVVAPYFKSFQNIFSAKLIPSFLFNITPYFIIAGTSLTIMIISRWLRTHNIYYIDQTEELNIRNILMESDCSETLKKEWAEKIAANPGYYSPFSLVYASIYFIKKKDYEKAAVLCIGGICRSEIDVKISGDKTTSSTPGVSMMRINEAVVANLKKDREFKAWDKARRAAFKNFIEWDQKTPRNYDDRWIHTTGMGAFTGKIEFIQIRDREKRRVIEDYYKEHAINVSKLD